MTNNNTAETAAETAADAKFTTEWLTALVQTALVQVASDEGEWENGLDETAIYLEAIESLAAEPEWEELHALGCDDAILELHEIINDLASDAV